MGGLCGDCGIERGDCQCVLRNIEQVIDALADDMPSQRERIATAVLAAMYASPNKFVVQGTPTDGAVDASPLFAQAALVAADALIAELGK